MTSDTTNALARTSVQQPRKQSLTPALRGVWRWSWRTTVRGAAGLPLALAAVPLTLVGAWGPAARAQRAMVRRFGPGDAGDRTARGRAAEWAATREAGGRASDRSVGPGPLRVLAHSAAVLLPALVAFVCAALIAWGVYAGYLYFIRPDASFAIGHPFTPDDRFHTSWGGPTLVGAWFVHSCVALGFQIGSLLLIRGCLALQDRATRRLLGG
ncbi:hypothetical protein LRS74_23635 [Streptomyces sp. LX-29]|uniref:hypothetical protein n=1 Tax=Streptomyces sp. LX-29 TaxID=2900152 RepID=UPI00240D1BB8|nr:hypothetical protein [Streptomyces sp. LX-29]WFB09707.1 hypothetical protein LRS74_23635 [Streptomyces sp. LX-29]